MPHHRSSQERRTCQASVAGLSRSYVTEFLYGHIKNANLQRRGDSKLRAKDYRFSCNEEFWEIILNEKEMGLRWVELDGFQLVDWFPRTPGLYHTKQAKQVRQRADRYVQEEDGVVFYEPCGKFHMIQGGLGSIRFKPIMIEGSEHWLCTTTSDGFCHSGIPIAVPKSLAEQAEFAFNYLCRVTGQVKFLPEFLEHHFLHMTMIPQIYIQVDDIVQVKREKQPVVEITPMIFFLSHRKTSLHTGDNVTYVRCRADSITELNRASEWLEWYVDRYGGKIMTNFDQQRPTFANAPFSLQNVMSGKLDPRDLQRYSIKHADIVCEDIRNLHTEEAIMTKISVKLGDGTTVNGDFVVANSIKDSFNKADAANVSDELKVLLKELAKAVGKMSELLSKETAEQVARDLENLTTEVTSKAPRKQWWKLSVEGLRQVAQTVGEIGKPVMELLTKILTILKITQS